jgi:hypothetical protein
VQIHGFLTVNGEKMSKRTGTFVLVRTYLDHLDPAFLRYYYASKLGPRVEDLDLNLEEFVDRVNSHLIGKVVNLASRSARFVEGRSLAATYPDDEGLFAPPPPGRRDRARLRRMRLRPRDARGDGARRPRQRVRRPQAALAAEEAARARGRAGGRLHGGAQPLPAARRLPRARAPQARR